MIQKTRLHRIWHHLVWQLIAAVLFVTIVLFALGAVAQSALIWAVGAGALSSSACLVFSAPDSPVSKPSCIFGGYTVGLSIGLLMHILLTTVFAHIISSHPMLGAGGHVFWACASIAVGLTMLCLVLFGFGHPPAVGVSLVLVLDIRHYTIVWVILLCAFLLTIIRWVLGRYLVNLL